MRCRILTTAGQVVVDGVCGIRRDGGFELVPVRATRPLQPGEGPVLVATGTQQYPARVAAVHRAELGPRDHGGEVYHLTPLVADEAP
jgi:hypothetical protein